MLCFKLAAFVAAILISINGVSSQLNANPTIPDHLLECYRNSSIYYRGNRLPSNLRSLLDLIRKVESSPTGRNMGAKEMSLALTYTLRLDGIVQTPTIQQTDNIIPYAPGGDEYYKHRLTLVGLLPKADPTSSYNLINESLSTVELCNLHFMLSYSIDAYKRDDEQCSNILYETNNFYRPDYYNRNRPTSTIDPYYPDRNYGRWRRDAKDDKPKRKGHETEYLEKKERMANHPKKHRTDKDRILKKKEMSRYRRYVDGSEEHDKNTEVEEIPPAEVENRNIEKNQDFRIGNEHYLGVRTDHIMRGGYQDVETRPEYRPDKPPMRPQLRTVSGSIDKRTAPAVGITSKTVIPNVPFSECPIENGVIQTQFGSVTIGTVVAGIAAGLNRQNIDPTQLNVNPNDIKPELKGVKVDNVWATTLAGNTADMILSLGIINDINQAVGLPGGWNDTYNPKWYLLKTKDIKYLTDVELRGALDGLLLGKVVASWVQKFNTLKLSQILDMYYSQVGSVFDPNVQACKRRENLVQYAPTDEFSKQVHIFCQVMNTQRINTVTIKDFTTLTENTVTNINSYVPHMDSASCSTRSSVADARQQGNIDQSNQLTLVVDGQYEYDSVYSFLYYLIMNEVAATPFQSNTTIRCGKDGQVLAVLTMSDLQTSFTRDVYQRCAPGFNINLIYREIEYFQRKVYLDEKNGLIINTLAQVVLFLPSSRLENTSDITNQRRMFNETFPDLRFFVATQASRDTFANLVNDQNRDIFTVRLPLDSSSAESAIQLVNRIKSTPQRLAKIQCGPYYSDDSDGKSSVIDNIRVGYTKYYRLHPNYFYSADKPKITVTSKQAASLTVCYSRTNEQPTGDGTQYNPPSQSTNSYNQPITTPSTSVYGGFSPNKKYFASFARQTDTTTQNCKTITGDPYVISLEDPCDDADTISECAPLYISIFAPRPDDSGLSLACYNCRFPTNVEYEISLEDCTCDSGVGTLIFSPIIALFSIIVIYLNNN